MGGTKESDQENDGNKKGLQLDPGFVSIDAEDDLDCSRARHDKNLELWLLQIPLDFPLDEKVVWRATEPGSDRLSAICEIEDAGHRLVEEQETGQAPVYAIGGGDDDLEPTKVTRRLNVVKRTDAQKVCFGIEDTDVLEEVDAGPASPSPAATTPSKDKAAKKEKKKDKKKKREETSAEPDTEQKKKKSKKK